MAKVQNVSDILKKKQWSKYISKGISLSLMHYNPKSKLFKSYKNTSYCAEVLATDKNGKLTATYCKNRWCQTCNRIKTAMMINGYAPQIEKLFQPVFVTLTLPTCTGSELKNRISEMEKTWSYILRNSKNKKFLKEFQYFKGIRKAEITIAKNNLYHYHYHFIVDGWGQGEWLMGQWLKKFPQANRKGQDLRFIDEFGKFELFKYAIKAEVKTDNQNAKRYDLVFNALRGKRIFSAFGGIRKIEEEFEDDDLKANITLENQIEQVYKWVGSDWFNKETGEALINIPIPKKVENMVEYPNEK